LILKSALTRTGVDSVTVMDAHLIPTDAIQVPETEAIQPVQDLVSRALDNRPDIAQSRIQLENADIILSGTRNALLKQQKKVDKEPSAKAGRAKAKTKPKSKTKHVVK
jgi:hypothetical protein